MEAIARRTAAPAFTLAVFVNAGLIFALQPLFARMITPLMGGSPSVWNASMAFFQAALLLGYLYAHALQRIRNLAVQGVIHAILLAAGALMQPIAVSGALGPPDPLHPAAWTLGVLALSVGLPFVAASATAPLLQAWYARTGRADAHDPYYLYAASNLGSLIGLIGYPAVVEPLVGAQAQTLGWFWGYLAAAAVVMLCLTLARLAHARADAPPAAEQGESITWRRRLFWLAAAAAPSSLLLGVTQHIATDVASAPFLWAAPLALYLATFIIAFARGGERAAPAALVLHPIAMAFLVLTYFANRDWGWALLANLATFFLSALICHQALAATRPQASRLTEFYLWMSAGGVLGGALTALAAPVIFTGVYEYPLALAACALFHPRRGATLESLADTLAVAAVVMTAAVAALAMRTPIELSIYGGGIGAAAAIAAAAWPAAQNGAYSLQRLGFALSALALAGVLTYAGIRHEVLVAGAPNSSRAELVEPMRWIVLALSFLTFSFITHAALQARERVTRIALGIAAPLTMMPVFLTLLNRGFGGPQMLMLAIAICAAAIFMNRHRPWLMAGLILVAFAAIFGDDTRGVRIIHQERSFFGVVRVEELPTLSEETQLHVLMHGTTIHGAQLVGQDQEQRPLTYYSPETSLGEAIVAGLAASTQGRIALVGLGAGSTACLTARRDELTVFEIDANVVRLSTGADGYFTYMHLCQPEARIVLGDARLGLAREPDERFDIIVLDAFSSDAVPAHLLTREAMAMYLRKLSPTGVLVLHLSNRNLALVAEAARVARDLDAGWTWRVSQAAEDPLAMGYGGLPSSVMIVARTQSVVDDLPLTSTDWRVFAPPTGRAWTDDYINLPRALFDSLTGREYCITYPERCTEAE
ncbi:MAG: hypothetical protein GC189_01380 [Alphaproteobacteria bacterium]|nr:hypothetical protein [Alphaproteobacteria bacterium]